MREKGDDFNGRRRRFGGRRGMILKRGEGKDFEGGGGRLGRGNKMIFWGGGHIGPERIECYTKTKQRFCYTGS